MSKAKARHQPAPHPGYYTGQLQRQLVNPHEPPSGHYSDRLFDTGIYEKASVKILVSPNSHYPNHFNLGIHPDLKLAFPIQLFHASQNCIKHQTTYVTF